MLHLPTNRKPLSDLALQSLPSLILSLQVTPSSSVSAASLRRHQSEHMRNRCSYLNPTCLCFPASTTLHQPSLFHTSLTHPANRRPPAPHTNASKRSSLSLPLVSRPLRAFALAACNHTNLSRRTKAAPPVSTLRTPALRPQNL
jgi:hypothetical protein